MRARWWTNGRIWKRETPEHVVDADRRPPPPPPPVGRASLPKWQRDMYDEIDRKLAAEMSGEAYEPLPTEHYGFD